MTIRLELIEYDKLNARQKENFNFQKISAVLADYGYATLRLTDDWLGADFIAVHIDGVVFLKVQLKGRLTFNKKYIGKSLHIAFPHKEDWYLFDHDKLLKKILKKTNVANTDSWHRKGGYSFPGLGLVPREGFSVIPPLRLRVKLNTKNKRENDVPKIHLPNQQPHQKNWPT